jgi:MFS family permease
VSENNAVFVQKNLLRNFIVNIFDGAFFGFGIGFASFTTIIPLFVSQLTNSPILIGLIPAIHSMGWQLPQLLIAQRVSKLSRLRQHVLILSIQERAPFLGLAVVSLFLTKINPTLTLVIIFFLLIWQGLGAGVTANGWQNLIGKIIPSANRGTFFGMQSAAANLLASVGAVIAGVILQRSSSSSGFTICFLLAVLLLGISWVFLSLTKEPVTEVAISDQPTTPLWTNVTDILKKDRPFFGFLISRTIYQIGTMGSAFFIIYWVKKIHIMDIAIAGVMTGVLMVTQVIAGPILGWIADHWGHKRVFVLGAISASLSAIIAWLAPTQAWSYLVMVLSGIASTVFWSVGMTYTLDFGNDQNRPTYVGMLNTFGAPIAVLAPLLGGLLAQIDYKITFVVSAVAALVTAVVLMSVVKTNHAKI